MERGRLLTELEAARRELARVEARRRELEARRPTGEARRVLAGALRRIRGEAARLEATIWAYESELGDMAEMAVIIIEGGKNDEDHQTGEPEEREDHPAL